MPRIPTYDSMQVDRSSLQVAALDQLKPINTAEVQAPQFAPMKPPVTTLLGSLPMMQAPRAMPDIAGKTLQAQGEQVASAGRAVDHIATQMVNQANQTRVTEALTDVIKTQTTLEADPQQGYQTQTGKNAMYRDSGLSLSDEYTQKFKDNIDQIAQGLGNDVQRESFYSRAYPMLYQFQRGVMGHESKQSNVYSQTVLAANIDAQENAIGLNPMDPRNDQRRGDIRDATKQLALLQGKSPEAADYMALQSLSRSNKVAISSLLNDGSAEGLANAKSYLKQALEAKEMLADDGLAMQKSINQVERGFTIQNATQRILEGIQPQLQDSNLDKFQTAIGINENNKHWNPDGSVSLGPMTKSGQAVGQYQMLESTAKEVANRTGGPGWDKALFYQKMTGDPAQDARAIAYHKALSMGYIQQLYQQYGGDTTKTAAAYNAGPGAVDKAINEAKKDGTSWLSKLPAETQAYVPSVLASFNNIFPKPIQNSEIVQRVKSLNLEPDIEQRVLSQVNASVTRTEQDQAQFQTQSIANAFDKVLKSGGDTSQLTQDDLRGIPANRIDDLYAYGDRLKARQDKTDPETLIQLKLLDQNQLANLDVNTFKASFQDKLSTSDLGSFIDKIQAAQGKGDIRNKALVTKDEIVKDSAQLNGILKTSTAGMSEQQKAQMGHRFLEFSQAVDDRVNQELDANPQLKLDRGFFQKCVDDVMKEQVLRPTFMSRIGVGQPESVSPYTMDIPKSQEDLIRSKLSARGITPTRQMIADLWIKGGQQK